LSTLIKLAVLAVLMVMPAKAALGQGQSDSPHASPAKNSPSKNIPAPGPAAAPDEAEQPATAACTVRHELDNMLRCIDFYEKYLQINSHDVEVNLNYAEAILWFEGYHNRGSQNVILIQAGIKSCQLVLQAEPDNILAHYINGILNGFYGQYLDSLGSFSYFTIMEDELQWVLDHQADFDYGGAYRVLGRYYSRLPGIFGGDDDKAENYYFMARKLFPEYLLNEVLLGELYMQEGRLDEALEILQPVLQSTAPPPDLASEWHMWVRQARALAQQLDLAIAQREQARQNPPGI
jgi:tetratricopeptide (TPR) repeat protein